MVLNSSRNMQAADEYGCLYRARHNNCSTEQCTDYLELVVNYVCNIEVA